jgi:hypothetical protein
LLEAAETGYDPRCWGCLGPRLIGKVLLRGLADDKLFGALQCSFRVHQAGLLYPFSYEDVGDHLRAFVPGTARFVRAFRSIGMHFYGKSSASVMLAKGSNMHRAICKNTLFGGAAASVDLLDPWWVVRKVSVPYCSIGTKIKRNSEVAAGQDPPGPPKDVDDFGFATVPRDVDDFGLMLRQKQIVLLCHATWLGIREMTVKIGAALGLPIVMVGDGDLTNEEGLVRMSGLLQHFGARVLAVQGIPPGTLKLAKRLYEDKIVRVAVVYHSGVSVHNVALEESGLVGSTIASAAQHHIALAFIENDQATFVRHMGLPACAIPSTFVPPPQRRELPPAQGQSPLRIGLLGTGTRLAVKNFFTQISAACMFPGAELHVNDLPAGPWHEWYLNYCLGRIVVHGHMDSVTFARWLGKMHVNMYVSWTDAVPNVVVDSLAAGVPVIVSDTSPWFDGSPELKDLLVEPRSDDPGAIYRRVVRTLAFARDHRPTFTRLVKDMMERSRARAVASWDCFLDGLAAGEGIMCPAERTWECKPLRREDYDPLVLIKGDGHWVPSEPTSAQAPEIGTALGTAPLAKEGEPALVVVE